MEDIVKMDFKEDVTCELDLPVSELRLIAVSCEWIINVRMPYIAGKSSIS
jgi:hypothetical protein